MKQYFNLLRLTGLTLIAFLISTNFSSAQTQLPECNPDVPFFILDLSSDPDSIYTTPEVVRNGQCCGDDANQNYVSFYVTLHPDVAMVEIGIAPGYADPGGSGFYNIVSGGDINDPGICGPNIAGGQVACITGSGPHKITYHKPGANKVKYYLKQIPKPIYPADQPTRYNCLLPLEIFGLNSISITAIATTGSASLATCNTYMSCLNCSTPVFEPGANATYPYTIDYKICGTPQASACGTFASCDTVQFTVYGPLSIDSPETAFFCSDGPGVLLTATASGGDGNYTYFWLNSNLDTVSYTNNYTATASGSYTAYVFDGLSTATCPDAQTPVSVTVADPPIADAGLDKTTCATSPTVFLNGSVQNASGGIWSGGSGTFNPNPTNLVASYTPSSTEIDAGFAELILTTTGAGGGCTNDSDTLIILISDTLVTNIAASQIVCYGSTSSVSASVSGGEPGYAYQWSTGETTASINVPAGAYTLIVTDMFSCTDYEMISVTQPSPIILTMSSTNESSDGACDGTASVAITGGDGPYTQLWSSGGTGLTESSLCYGTYTVDVTDANGCIVQGSVVVNNFTCSAFDVDITGTDVDCYLGNNGTATANIVSGGTAPFTYLWSPGGETTSSISGLTSGSYTVLVTDDNGCYDVAGVTILQPVALTNTITHTDVTSIGGTDGTATANPLGGTPGYTYLWTPSSQITQTATGLSTGMYYVEITDSKLCTKDDSVYINQPPCNDFFLAVSATHVSCNGGSDGTANLYISDGTPPYSISWSSGETDVMSVTDLDAGNYTVTVTDNSGCTTFKTFTITEPDPLSLSLVPTNVTCNGDMNGTIELTVLGGTYPFNYVWVSGGKVIANYEDLVDLGPGTYTVTVTDANGCVIIGNIGITEPPKLIATFDYVDNECFGLTNGSVDVTTVGGTTPYNFNWTGPSGYTNNTEDISGLATGFYELNITDLNGCDFGPVQVFINQPSLLTASGIMTNEVTCAGGNDGAIDLTVLGGTSPYLYDWTGPSSYTATTQNISGLIAGVYDVTVTDDQGCTATESVSVTTVIDITNPNIICTGNQSVTTSSSTCTFTQTSNAWNASATDNCMVASVSYVLTGATSGSGTTLNGISFNIGTTTVTWTATDGLGNTDVCSFDVIVTDITSPTLTSCVASPQNVNVDAGQCNYTVSGTAWDATATDNCSVSTILADLTGATVANDLTTLNGVDFNLGTTTVTWTVTDGSGNTSTCIFNVVVTDNILPTLTSCVGSNQTVDADAGECNYTVSGTAWDATASDNCSVTTVLADLTGATVANDLSTLNGVNFNLGTTTVTWTVTDGSGNVSTCIFNVLVEDNQLPSFTACVGSTQNVVVDAGQCNYTVSGTAWDATASDNCTVSTVLATLSGATSASNLITLNGVDFNLGTTTVTWTVTDGSGNTSTCIFNVVVTDNILPSIISCGASGDQVVNANVGLCTYTHPNSSWNASGSDNCSLISLTYSLSGATSGTGTTLSGETFNLGTTLVTWIATDNSGNTATCSFNVTVNDTQLPVITNCGPVVNQSVQSDAGECNYTVSGTAWDATASDNCSVSTVLANLTGATTASNLTTLNGVNFNLGTTTVVWTVTDGSGNISTCSFQVTVTDNQLPAITSCGASGNQLVTADPGVCTFTMTGTAWDATASDNCTVSTLIYTLSGATTGSGTSLDGVVFNPGTTTVTWTVTDQSGNTANCSFQVAIEDTEFPVISSCPSDIVIDSDNGSCGAIVNWTVPSYTDNCGASMTFTHVPGTFFPVGTTTVTYTVTDGGGNITICSFDIIITDNEQPIISCNEPIETCDPIVTYNAPVVSDNCAVQDVVQTSGLPSGSTFPVGVTTNTFEVTDIHGNISSCSFTVTVFPLPVIDLIPVDVSCYDDGNGSIDATLTVGTEPYTFDWSNGFNTEDISSLEPGQYILNVIDDNGCTASANATISQPELLTLEAVNSDVNCFNGTDGAIDISVTGGISTYDYAWSNGATSEDVTDLPQGDIDVVVTDQNGCIVTYSTTIEQPDSLLIQYQVYDATCNAANGTIAVQVTGGATPYEYQWSDGSQDAYLANVVSGTYTFDVTDANNCTNTFTATISSSSNISASASARNVTCYGANNGEIQISMLSGNAPFTYEWSNGGSTPGQSDLAAGDYSVIITDVFGCQTTVNATITQPDSLYVTLTSSVYPSGDNVSTNNGNDGYINSSVTGGVEIYSYSWLPSNESTPSISNLSAGSYTCLVTDQHGCIAKASMTLTQPDDLLMPSGFSPNDDGDNDYFVIRGIDAYPENNIVIYNRWGNMIYERDGYKNEWHGENMNNEPLPDATYFVILKAKSGDEEIVLTGYVDLRR